MPRHPHHLGGARFSVLSAAVTHDRVRALGTRESIGLSLILRTLMTGAMRTNRTRMKHCRSLGYRAVLFVALVFFALVQNQLMRGERDRRGLTPLEDKALVLATGCFCSLISYMGCGYGSIGVGGDTVKNSAGSDCMLLLLCAGIFLTNLGL